MNESHKDRAQTSSCNDSSSHHPSCSRSRLNSTIIKVVPRTRQRIHPNTLLFLLLFLLFLFPFFSFLLLLLLLIHHSLNIVTTTTFSIHQPKEPRHETQINHIELMALEVLFAPPLGCFPFPDDPFYFCHWQHLVIFIRIQLSHLHQPCERVRFSHVIFQFEIIFFYSWLEHQGFHWFHSQFNISQILFRNPT